MMKIKITSHYNFGPIFKGARKAKKLTIHQVATKAGYAPQTIINIEKNIGSVRTETLVNVAKVVGLEIVIKEVEA